MRKHFILPLVFVLLVAGFINGQNQSARFGLTTKVNLMDNLTPLDGFNLFNKNNFSEATAGAEIGFFRNLNKFVNVGIPLRLGVANVRVNGMPDQFDDRMNFSVDLVGQLGYFAADYFITPYITAGVGYQLESYTGTNNHGAAFPVGLGLNLRVFPGIYLQAQSEYRFTTLENREQILYGAGFMFALNRNAKEKPVDADGDGISDAEDECPLLKGTVALKGCPDADEDMVADKNDACPAEAGLAKFGGCPDTDNDGVMDKEDDCPTEAGTLANNGCPVKDADSDGVEDKDDRCPNEAGPASNAGCPVVVLTDSDEDGVPDREDRCPTSPGTIANNGCPEITVEDKEILNLAVSNVEFESARATLKMTSFATLDQIADLMNKYPDYNLSINGHTDSVGSSKINQILSERRAKSCYDYLTKKGINPGRINYAGYGETQPIADNRFKDGREQNRRVEFNLYLK